MDVGRVSQTSRNSGAVYTALRVISHQIPLGKGRQAGSDKPSLPEDSRQQYERLTDASLMIQQLLLIWILSKKTRAFGSILEISIFTIRDWNKFTCSLPVNVWLMGVYFSIFILKIASLTAFLYIDRNRIQFRKTLTLIISFIMPFIAIWTVLGSAQALILVHKGELSNDKDTCVPQ